MKVGKIVLQSGAEAEFGVDGWTSSNATIADYLNLMFGKETYRAAQGSFGVQIIHAAAGKLNATVQIYPRAEEQAVPGTTPAAGPTVSQGFDPNRIMDDDDEEGDDDNWQDMMKLWE